MVRHLVLLPLAFLGMAASPGADTYYRAQPVAAAPDARIITRDSVWRCGASDCTADRSGSRPAIVCARLAHEIGALRSFSVDGRPFDTAALESCNRRAR
jgi:hypothetical protein